MSKQELLAKELDRLVSIYGVKAVRDNAKRLASRKTGRPVEPDFPHLKELAELDARDWLVGRDPFRLRSNKSIAVKIAAGEPIHKRESTIRRIMRKLQRHRRVWMKVKAMWISEVEFPFARHFEVAREVEALSDYAEATAKLVDLHRGALERYCERYGQAHPDLTIREIVEASRRPLPPPEPQNFKQIVFSKGVTKS